MVELREASVAALAVPVVDLEGVWAVVWVAGLVAALEVEALLQGAVLEAVWEAAVNLEVALAADWEVGSEVALEVGLAADWVAWEVDCCKESRHLKTSSRSNSRQCKE